MTLRLNGIDVDCVIGERPDERTRLQTLRVDIELEIPDDAAETDSLSDTVDYAALTEIERAAKIVKDICLSDAKVRAAKVSVTKSGAVPHLESAQAVL